MHDTDGQWTIRQGDHLTIRAQGIVISGTVLSANFWGDKDGWYIELATDQGGYSYWKQGCDGGEIMAVQANPHTDPQI